MKFAHFSTENWGYGIAMATIIMTTAATCESVFYKPSSVNVHKLTVSDIDEVVEEEMTLQNILGVVVGIVEDGKITHTRAYGFHDEDRTDPVKTSTVFRYASLSKPVTALAVFRAIADGKMKLTDKVADIVDYWPTDGQKDDITIAHLLSHRSGICHYGDDADGNKVCNLGATVTPSDGGFNAKRSVSRFNQCDLLFIPGTDHTYSTFGYDLLGAAIEEATGTDYVEYVEKHIKDVAGLSTFTAFSPSPGGYRFDCNLKRQKENEGNTNIRIPGGGWCSNIRDLARLMLGIMEDEFIPSSYALWQAETFSNSNKNYVYGFKRRTINGVDFVYHGGVHDDVRTYMGFFPGDKNGVVLMMNYGNGADSDRFGEKLLEKMGYGFNPSDLPINDNRDKEECGETMVSVWRKTGEAEETVIRRGLDHNEFLSERNALQDRGWYLVDMETYLDGTRRKWDGIFKKGVAPTSIWRNFSTNDFFDKWEEENAAGRRLIDIEVYKSGSVNEWAGLFQGGNSGAYYMYRDYNTEDFGDKHTELKNRGIKLIDIETYTKGTNRKWAGVWLGSGTSLLNRNYREDDFIQLCRDRSAAGYKLIDMETYVDGTVRKYAGVWEPASESEARWFNVDMGTWVNEKHNELIKDGYELLDLEKK